MSKDSIYKFRLYVAGHATNSTQAIANLKAICHERLPERHSIEIVDVLVDPKRALADGVLLTPTLVKLSPLPTRKIIGTLSQLQTVLEALDLPLNPS